MPKTTKPVDPSLLGMPDRARQARKDAGLGVREVGEKSGNGVAFVSRLENGKRIGGLTVSLVLAHARALGVNVQWLLTGEGPQRSDGRYVVMEITPQVIEMINNAKAELKPTGAVARRKKFAD